MSTWAQIRSRFTDALANRRVDRWLVEESRERAEIMTKFYSLNDIVAFSKFLDEQVDKEKAQDQGRSSGAEFISLTPMSYGSGGI